MNALPDSVCGRLAPSPTGLLHVGNAWSFFLAWLSARTQGGRVVLRMEDIDPARSRQDFAQAQQDDLRWLGLDWDGQVVWQSARQKAYGQALNFLEKQSSQEGSPLIYPCFCTRKELRQAWQEMQEIAGAPHALQDFGDMGFSYPGTCRHLSPAQRSIRKGQPASLRLACSNTLWNFHDAVQGKQSFSLQQCGGDFALRRSDGVWAYQLAVVVDDIDVGVTEVVRGDDILLSTPRQLYLYQLFGQPAPTYAHIPLLHDAQGERLAKRHQNLESSLGLTLVALRQAGITPENMVAYMASLAGCPISSSCTPWQVVDKVRSLGGMQPLWKHLGRTKQKLLLPEDFREKLVMPSL